MRLILTLGGNQQHPVVGTGPGTLAAALLAQMRWWRVAYPAADNAPWVGGPLPA